MLVLQPILMSQDSTNKGNFLKYANPASGCQVVWMQVVKNKMR